MAKRSEVIKEDSLSGLYTNHPYLLLFQKENWQEYIYLIAQIYDLLEEQSARIPFEVVRSQALKYYSQKKLQYIENKIGVFFNMAISELVVFRDSHDSHGQRFIEGTKYGKALLQLVESLLLSRTKFTGTSAETLLGTLNNILLARDQMSVEDAISHHKERIKAYTKDIQRIETQGLAHAELLPMPHSIEAQFNQSEEAAIHLLSSIEDVKLAIERNRQELSKSYFEKSKSAGQNLSTVAEFYEALYKSNEYISYTQAKGILSHLEGYNSRFQNKNIDRILNIIAQRQLLPDHQLQRSHLKTFTQQFQNADTSIQDKIKSQLQLLQQQVHYAISTDIHGVHTLLSDFTSLCYNHRERALNFFEAQPLEVSLPIEFESGRLELFNFETDISLAPELIIEPNLEEQEHLEMLAILLQAEEMTLQNVIDKIRQYIKNNGSLNMTQYPLSLGLAEYYVLTEIELFATDLERHFIGNSDLICRSKNSQIIIRNSPCYQIGPKVLNIEPQIADKPQISHKPQVSPKMGVES